MTIDEAISLLKQYIDYNNPDIPDFYTMEEACEVVIKAFEQKQCGDCISREALLVEIKNGIKAGNYEEGYEQYPHINDMNDIIECIKYADAVTPMPKMGRWEKHDVRGQRVDCCSVCGLSNGTIYEYNYCPNCGAKMQEVEE